MAKPLKLADPARHEKLTEITQAIEPAYIFDTYWVCYVILWRCHAYLPSQHRSHQRRRTALLEIPDSKLTIALAIGPKRKLIKHLDRTVAQKENRRDAALLCPRSSFKNTERRSKTEHECSNCKRVPDNL